MARDTTFYLYKNVNITGSDTHYFANRSAQSIFFNSKLYRSVTACSYQRENRNYFTVPLTIAQCYDIDYCAFINTSYENMMFYCYVTGVEYISDNATMIFYEVDEVQTWLLSATLNPCFIERCHSITDDIGDNLLEENFDLGDYLIRYSKDNVYANEDILVIFQCTFDILHWIDSIFTDKNTNTTAYIRNGVVDGLGMCAVYLQFAGQFAGNTSALKVILQKLQQGSGTATMDDVVNIYLYSKLGIKFVSTHGVPGSSGYEPVTEFAQAYEIVPEFTDNQTWTEYGRQVSLPSIPVDGQGNKTIGTYIPKNNKLFTYPFTLLHVTNNNGSAIDLRYERFNDPDNPKALINGTTTAEAKIRLTPKEYFGGDEKKACFEYSIDSAPFPMVSISADAFNIWIAQNRNTIYNNYEMMNKNYNRDIITQGAGGLASLFGASNSYSKAYNKARGNLDLEGMDSAKSGLKSAAIGTGIGTLAQMGGTAYDYYNQTKAAMLELKDKMITPATASGVQSTGLSYQNNKQSFSFYVKTIDEAHARAIDDFFTMYGYPARYLAVPPMHNRSAFTYVKTIGCIVTGSLPETAKTTIQNAFNNGIRFWADHTNIGNYTVANNILT